MGLLWLLYPEVRWQGHSEGISLKFCPLPHPAQLRIHRPVLVKTLIVTSLLLTAFMIGLPLAESAFLAAAALLVTRRIKSQRVLQQVELRVIVYLFGFKMSYQTDSC